MKKRFLFGLIIFGFCTPNLNAQSKSSGEQTANSSQPIVEFTENFDKRFLKRDPKIGAKLANVNAFDEKGNPLELDSTRGKYTVIVFGCLT